MRPVLALRVLKIETLRNPESWSKSAGPAVGMEALSGDLNGGRGSVKGSVADWDAALRWSPWTRRLINRCVKSKEA